MHWQMARTLDQLPHASDPRQHWQPCARKYLLLTATAEPATDHDDQVSQSVRDNQRR